MAKVITDANFAEILNTDKLVVVDFWATWCGPCKMIAPIVDELAQEYEGKADICKCNVNECDDVPMTYNIRSIPTLLFFKNGEVVDRHVGAASKADLAAKIESYL
jgi:thioredoxin 1